MATVGDKNIREFAARFIEEVSGWEGINVSKFGVQVLVLVCAESAVLAQGCGL